jgi:hypothetical protein
MARPDRFRPTVFQRPVSTSVKARVLGEMVEGVAWAVEASADIMATIIGAAPILTSCLSLRTT